MLLLILCQEVAANAVFLSLISLDKSRRPKSSFLFIKTNAVSFARRPSNVLQSNQDEREGNAL